MDNNITIFEDWTMVSTSFRAIFSHPDDRDGEEIGSVILNNKTDMNDLMLKVFRMVWEGNHYYHKAVVTFTTYYEPELFNEIWQVKHTIEGAWYDSDEEILATHRVTKKILTEKEGA